MILPFPASIKGRIFKTEAFHLYSPQAIIMTVTLMMMSSSGTHAQELNLRSDLCMPTVVGDDDFARSTSIPVADNAFLRHQYRLSFRAYYQYFFCFKGITESIPLGAEDSGAATILRDALSAGYDGQYESALRYARKSFAIDPRFGEAMLIAGNLEWILRNNTGARSDWELASATSGYPEPPGASVAPLYVRGANRFLSACKGHGARRSC